MHRRVGHVARRRRDRNVLETALRCRREKRSETRARRPGEDRVGLRAQHPLHLCRGAEVAGEAAVPFEADQLVETLQWAVNVPPSEREAWGRRASERIEKLYSWNAVTDQYEALLTSLGSK